jgi:hypothetical protein
MKTRGRGFTVVDLVVVIGVAGVLSAVGVPAVRMATSDNSLQRCRYNLRFLGQAGAMYREDFAGQMWALSWKSGRRDPQFGFTYGSDAEAQAFQAVYTLRRLAGLTPEMSPVRLNWIAPILYSHVALADYVGIPLPTSTFVCPLDARRMAYVNGDLSQYPQTGNEGTASGWTAPYSTSYFVSPYQWSPSRQTTIPSQTGSQTTAMFYVFFGDASVWGIDSTSAFVPPESIGPRRASDVRFPSQKVALADDYARHQGAPRYYAYSDAVQDLQFYDGSVRQYRTDHTNPGWNPSSQTNRKNLRVRLTTTKFADFWGGLDNNARSATFAAGWYRWTRGGLLGWDVPRLSSMVGRPPSNTVVENELDTRIGQW